jgi:hypothetical protein
MGDMAFRCLTDPDGAVTGIERMGAWQEEIDIAPDLLEWSDARFIAHGDGLLTFACIDETATYGIVGEAPVAGYPNPVVLHARLLTVRPNGPGAAC